MTYEEMVAQLAVYEDEYRLSREYFESDGIVTSEEQQQLDNISRMIDQIRDSLNSGVCEEPPMSIPPDEQVCEDPQMSIPPEDQVCEEPLTSLPEEAPICEDESVSYDTPSVPEAEPVCEGDDGGENQDNPVVMDPPQAGGSWFDDSSLTLNASASVIVNGSVVSSSDFPAGTSGTVAMDANQTGQVKLDMTVTGFEDNMVINGGFDQQFSVTWDVTIDNDGKLTIGSPAESVRAPSGSSSTWLRLDSVNPNQDATHRFVSVSPKVVGTSDSGGISLGVGLGSAAAPPFVQETFRLNINVCNIPEPEPEPEPPPQPVPTPQTHTVFFEEPRQADVSSTEERRLISWFQGLDEATRLAVESGSRDVDVTGYASTTGGEQMNRELSNSRAESVVDILRSFASSRLKANSRGRGEYMAETGDDVEDDGERRVEVSIVQMR